MENGTEEKNVQKNPQKETYKDPGLEGGGWEHRVCDTPLCPGGFRASFCVIGP